MKWEDVGLTVGDMWQFDPSNPQNEAEARLILGDSVVDTMLAASKRPKQPRQSFVVTEISDEPTLVTRIP